MEIRLSGPVEVWSAGRPIGAGTPRQRGVIAALAADAGRLVRLETLVDRVWGESPPDQVHKTLYVYISRIRGVIQRAGASQGRAIRLHSRTGGYLLEIDPELVDLHRFRRLVAGSHEAHRTERDRADLLRQALTVWRGTPLADLSGEWVTRVRAGWQQERIEVAARWAGYELRLDGGATVLGPLSDLIAEHPLAEPLVAAQIRALHATGQTAEALDCYAAIRQRLIDQLGVDAGPELQESYQAILRGPSSGLRAGDAPPAERAPLACTLPADSVGFTGRDGLIREIAALAAESADATRIVTVHGMAGVGKTALAVHIGHMVAGHLPDRRLFVDLHGHTAGHRPAEPADVLGVLLTSDGLDPRSLPATLAERAALWRDRMDGKRALLILDNAADSTQVAPLLPGAAGCLVLVTSRRYLGDLPSVGRGVALDVLSPDEAVAMFSRLVPRSAGEPATVASLVGMCGHLPLAISLLARVLTRHPMWTLDDLIAETGQRLLTVAAEERTIAGAFALSYHHLSVEEQRVFRRLGLHPGTDLDPHAAAALTGLSHEETVGHLDALHGNHLLDEPAFRRYRMHDLIRAYATDLARRTDPAQERELALRRLLDHYEHTAMRNSAYLSRHPRIMAPAPTAAPDLGSLHAALAWMETERANLLACLDHAHRHGQLTRLVTLTGAMSAYLRAEGSWQLAADLHAAAVDAARLLGNQARLATALHDLGDIRYLTSDYPGATTALHESLDLHRDIGDRLGEANVLNGLGAVGWLVGDHHQAATLLQQALDIHRELGSRQGEANDLINLGIVQWLLADFPGASLLLDQALDLFRQLNDLRGQANTLTELGGVRRLTGDYPGAAALLHQALDICVDIDDRRGQGNVLNELGVIAYLTGDHEGAAILLHQALDIYTELGNDLGRAGVFKDLGALARRNGDFSEAASALRRSLDFYRDIGDRDGEADLLNHLGMLYTAMGRPTDADTHHRQACVSPEAQPTSSPKPGPWKASGSSPCSRANHTSRSTGCTRRWPSTTASVPSAPAGSPRSWTPSPSWLTSGTVPGHRPLPRASSRSVGHAASFARWLQGSRQPHIATMTGAGDGTTSRRSIG